MMDVKRYDEIQRWSQVEKQTDRQKQKEEEIFKGSIRKIDR